MCVFVVTQSGWQADLLRNVLAEELRQSSIPIFPDLATEHAKVHVMHGTGSLSLAATLLRTRRQPVALVADSDSHVERVIKEKRDLLNEELRIASTGIPWRVILAVPQLEIICFQSPTFADWFRKPYTSELEGRNRLTEAKYKPRDVTDSLFAEMDTSEPGSIEPVTPWTSVFTKVPDRDVVIQEIRATPLISELLEFIDEQSGVIV
jgi:hypothetical protein